MDSFECALCLQQFNDPRVISCGHTFCKACLQKLKPNQLQCPLCRRTFDSVDLLPSNFVVLQWMGENKHVITAKKDICENCEEEKPAIVWCENCAPGTYYCKDCDSHIHSGRVTRNHIRLTPKEKSKRTIFTKCVSHLEENKFYCLDCKNLMCSVCKEDDHSQHKTMSIFKYGEILKNDLKKALLSFNETIKYFGEVEVVIKQQIKEKENERGQLKEKLIRIETDLEVKNIEKEKIIQQRQNTETILIVLTKSIEEIGVMEWMNKEFIDSMKERIMKIDQELCPVEVKERFEKERLEKERSEKERLEKERIELEEGRYTKKMLPAEWWDNTGVLGGIRKGTQKKEIYFIVSKSDKWDKGALYVPPNGYQWISTREYPPSDGEPVCSFYNQGGWKNYNWNGKDKYYFIFKDSHITNQAKHSGSFDNYSSHHTVKIENFAGLVCTKY